MAKAKSARKSVTSSSNPGQIVSAEERQRMIAEAAYFRAMERGFRGGNPMDDWLMAEREINLLLPSPQQQKQEMVAYAKLRERVRKILSEVRGTVNAETVRQAFDKATDDIKKSGEYTTDTINKITMSLRKDMAGAAQKMGPKWEAFTEKSADLFGVWRDRGSHFFAQAASAVGEWLRQAGAKLEQQTYRTGEMADSGTFECTACGERLALSTPAHLPRCTKCGKMEFRRI